MQQMLRQARFTSVNRHSPGKMAVLLALGCWTSYTVRSRLLLCTPNNEPTTAPAGTEKSSVMDRLVLEYLGAFCVQIL
jgi:hypothetical protein